jgi:hypothetical protein
LRCINVNFLATVTVDLHVTAELLVTVTVDFYKGQREETRDNEMKHVRLNEKNHEDTYSVCALSIKSLRKEKDSKIEA